MNPTDILSFTTTLLQDKGVEKVHCELIENCKRELNVEQNNLRLFRSNKNITLQVKAILDSKKVTMSTNDLCESNIKRLTDNIIKAFEAAQKDPANDIAPLVKGEYIHGPQEVDLEEMYHSFSTLHQDIMKHYPLLITDSTLSFDEETRYIKNTNGLDVTEKKNNYDLSVLFSAREEDQMSSFNYTGVLTENLKENLIDLVHLKMLLEQSQEQVETKNLESNFVGDIIIAPNSFVDLLKTYKGIALSNTALISGESKLKNSIGQKIASPLLTWISDPQSDLLNVNYSITNDGFLARPMNVIEEGVLQNFFLDQYGANKLSMKRSLNYGGANIIEPGESSYEEMIKSVDEGILFMRFSGGHPNNNGDFSGIAKNSYYIKNGKVQYPLSETMISGNLFSLFEKIEMISSERLNFGKNLIPWIKSTGITVSGK